MQYEPAAHSSEAWKHMTCMSKAARPMHMAKVPIELTGKVPLCTLVEPLGYLRRTLHSRLLIHRVTFAAASPKSFA